MADRSLRTIAADIKRDWKTPHFAAVPYLNAMSALNSMADKYAADDADTIVMYFLANASQWRGEVARTVKAELKAMLRKR